MLTYPELQRRHEKTSLCFQLHTDFQIWRAALQLVSCTALFADEETQAQRAAERLVSGVTGGIGTGLLTLARPARLLSGEWQQLSTLIPAGRTLTVVRVPSPTARAGSRLGAAPQT